MDLLTLAGQFGLPIAMLLLALWTGRSRIWVFGWYPDMLEKRIEALEAEKRAWENRAWEAQRMAGSAVTVAQAAIEPPRKDGS